MRTLGKGSPTRSARWAAGLAAVFLGASLVSAKPLDQEQIAQAADAVARTLCLVAADRGAPAALKLSGEPRLPKRLQLLLDAVAASPRARDLRRMGDELELKAGLLEAVFADVTLGEGARVETGGAALKRLREDVGAGLLDELKWLEVRQRGISLDVQSLHHDLDSVQSTKVIRERKRGPRLIHFASQSALLKHRLTTPSAAGRLEAGLRLFDRDAKPESLLLLRLLVRLAKLPELDAVSDGKAIRKTLAAVEVDLERRTEALLSAIQENRDDCRKTRTRELRSVVAGRRGAPMAEAVPMVKAYRRAFDALPGLEATTTWNVYCDRNDFRLHFWLPAEGRWVRGSERIHPIEPIVSCLLESSDLGLQLLATRSHALAQIYTLFLESFTAAQADLEKTGGALFSWVSKARKAAGPELTKDLDRALGARLGLAPELFGRATGNAGASREVMDHVLRIGLAQGAAAARAFRVNLGKARERTRKVKLRVVRLKIAGLPAEVPVDLAWSPPPRFPRQEDSHWLVAPPLRVRPGSVAQGIALGAAPIAVEAYAYDGAIVSAKGKLAPGKTLTLTLQQGKAGIALANLGGSALRAWSVPRESPALELFARGPQGSLRPLDAAERLVLTAADRGGTWTVEGRDATGAAQASASLTLEAVAGGVVTSAWPATPGSEVVAEIHHGGKARSGSTTWRLIDGKGALVHTQKGARFTWKASSTGRYKLVAPGVQSAWVAVAVSTGAVAVGSQPWTQRKTLSVGEPAFLRLDTWPTVLAEEVIEARWTLRLGDKAAREIRVRPQPGRVATALRLPIRIRAGVKPGKRTVSVELVTARRTIRVEGSFQVTAGGRSLQLKTRQEPLLRLPRPGQALSPIQVRASEVPASARWHLVGPAGDTRELKSRADRSVDVQLQLGDLEGPYELWFHGLTSDKTPVFGWLALRGVAVRELSLSAPKGPRIGETVVLEARRPRGFSGPFQVRLAGKDWQPGTSLKWEVKAANVIVAELLDSAGRLAQGTLDFEGRVPESARGPRVGIVANSFLKRIFVVDYARIANAQSAEGKLPRGWVVLEQGPMALVVARRHLWERFPYDGSGDRSQVAYRSQRFWKRLAKSARDSLNEAGITDQTPFSIMVTPLSPGEEGLRDRVGRHLATSGGWTYTLKSASLEASGVEASVVAGTLALEWAETSDRGGGLERVELAGPLADLWLGSSLPESLSLDSSHRLAFSASAFRKALETQLPQPFAGVAKQALVCPELEVEVTLDPAPRGSRPLKALIRTPGRDAATAAITFWLEHLSTTRDESLSGAPRKGERLRLHLLPHGGKGVQAALLEETLQPGTLENTPRRLVIKVRARLRRAVPSAKWPAGRKRPQPVRMGGVPFLFDPSPIEDLPGEAHVELTLIYERRAPGGTEKSSPAANLGVVRVGGVSTAATDRSALLATVRTALAERAVKDAERPAWIALHQRQGDPVAWALLADLALAREQLPVARARAEFALSLGARGDAAARAQLVLGRTNLSRGRFERAAAALRAGLAAGAKDPELLKRLEAFAGDL